MGCDLPNAKFTIFAFEFRAVADADDVHVLLEALCDAMNGIGNQRARQTMHGAMIVGGALHVQHAILLFKGDAVRNRYRHLALGSLHINLVRGDGDFYAGGQWNWFISDA